MKLRKDPNFQRLRPRLKSSTHLTAVSCAHIVPQLHVFNDMILCKARSTKVLKMEISTHECAHNDSPRAENIIMWSHTSSGQVTRRRLRSRPSLASLQLIIHNDLNIKRQRISTSSTRILFEDSIKTPETIPVKSRHQITASSDCRAVFQYELYSSTTNVTANCKQQSDGFLNKISHYYTSCQWLDVRQRVHTLLRKRFEVLQQLHKSAISLTRLRQKSMSS